VVAAQRSSQLTPDGALLYAMTSGSGTGAVQRVGIGASGATLGASTFDLETGQFAALAGGPLYFNSGEVVDPVQQRLLGTLRSGLGPPAVSLVQADPATGIVYFVTNDAGPPTNTPYVLRAFDAHTFLQLWAVTWRPSADVRYTRIKPATTTPIREASRSRYSTLPPGTSTRTTSDNSFVRVFSSRASRKLPSLNVIPRMYRHGGFCDSAGKRRLATHHAARRRAYFRSNVEQSTPTRTGHDGHQTCRTVGTMRVRRIGRTLVLALALGSSAEGPAGGTHFQAPAKAPGDVFVYAHLGLQHLVRYRIWKR
jgi:hypothetical protein